MALGRTKRSSATPQVRSTTSPLLVVALSVPLRCDSDTPAVPRLGLPTLRGGKDIRPKDGP